MARGRSPPQATSSSGSRACQLSATVGVAVGSGVGRAADVGVGGGTAEVGVAGTAGVGVGAGTEVGGDGAAVDCTPTANPAATGASRGGGGVGVAGRVGPGGTRRRPPTPAATGASRGGGGVGVAGRVGVTGGIDGASGVLATAPAARAVPTAAAPTGSRRGATSVSPSPPCSCAK